jgi:soluble lytic murein transglycosylase-like protein
MKSLKLIAVLLLTPTLLFSAPQPSRVNAKLIEAVCQVESNGRATAIGDGGKASGAFQFWQPTWSHTTHIRQRDGLPTTSYKEGSKDIKWSRLYAASYLKWIEKYIRDRGVEQPTAGQIYMGYNWGVGNARKAKFDVSKSPATTQRAIRKIEAWLKK